MQIRNRKIKRKEDEKMKKEMKKEMMAILAAGLMFAVAACGVKAGDVNERTDIIEEPAQVEEPEIDNETKTDDQIQTEDQSQNGKDKENGTEDQVQIPNPFVDCETMEEAEKLAGFSLTAPESIDGYSDRIIQAVEGELVQVIFTRNHCIELEDPEDLDAIDWENADFDSHDLMIRKGTGMEDISGDYNEYPEVETVSVSDRTVTLKEKDGLVHTAIWNADGYSYAVYAADGVSTDVMTALVSEVE